MDDDGAIPHIRAHYPDFINVTYSDVLHLDRLLYYYSEYKAEASDTSNSVQSLVIDGICHS